MAKLVLIVEDDPDTRRALEHVVKAAGYPVATAEHGQAALDYLLTANDSPGLILLDLMMPVLDGWQFLEEARQNPALSSIPVVVTSAAPDLPTDTAGALRKPLDLDELVGVLHQYC